MNVKIMAALIGTALFTPLAADQSKVTIKDFSGETTKQKDERMAWFNNARFGMFIHWGLYSQPAGIWKGKEIPGMGEWIQNREKIPVSDYEPLQKTFNPTDYSPEAWVLAAKQAGMKYIIITTKHHDGFVLYDSKFTDWDMGGTPYKKDLLKPLAEACRKHGLKICWYHSIMDWHHPHYGDKDIQPWRGNATIAKPEMEKYVTYMKNQLHELLTNYGDISIVWFDGEWEGSWTHEMGKDLYNYCRTLQPNTIINNRVDNGRSGMAGMTKKGDYAGDYGTPEQEIPKTGFGPRTYWESCMTMNDTWGFKKSDHKWKSPEKLIHNLVDISSKGGNFLLNVGPTAKGAIPSASMDRLKTIGQWMDINSQSIHGTQANPFPSISWNGRCTMKVDNNSDTQLFFHLFEWPKDGKLNIPELQNPIQAVSILGQKTDNLLPVSGKPGNWSIQLPEAPTTSPENICTVVKVSIKGVPNIVTK